MPIELKNSTASLRAETATEELAVQRPDSDARPSLDMVARGLLKCVDVLIGVLILILPFVMGGREAWGHWLLVSAAGALGTCWCLYSAIANHRYRVSWLELFFLGGLAIVCLQLQPQSADQLANFSTEYERLLPTWTSTQQVDSALAHPVQVESKHWTTISFTPAETRHAVAVLLAYGLIALVFFQRLRTQEDCQRALQTIAVSGVLMTLFGLLQWASSNGKFFWVYKHPFTDPTEHLKAAFTNRNHFAQFLALSIGPLLWWLVTLIRRALSTEVSAVAKTSVLQKTKSKGARKRGSTDSAFTLTTEDSARMLTIPILILVVCIATVGLSVLLSLSRGGMLATIAAVLIATIGLWRGFNLPGTMAALLLGTSVIIFSGLAFVDQEQVQTRVEELISGDAEKVDAGGVRRAVWSADAKVIKQFPLLGTGIGSHRDVYSLYMDNYADFATFELTHAESSYIHLALEAGLIGCGLLILGLLWFIGRLAWGYFTETSYERRSIIVAVAASAAAGILHAVTDFIWYVPSIVVVSLLLVAVGLNSVSRQISFTETSFAIPLPKIVWLGMAVMCAVVASWAQPNLFARIDAEQHWYASLNTKLQKPLDDDGYSNLKAGDTITLDDEAAYGEDQSKELTHEQIRKQRLAEINYLKTRLQHLRRCIAARPDQHRPQLAMAENLLRLFDLLQQESTNPLPLNMVRDAAVSANFKSTDELKQWLDAACENRIQLVYMADRLSRQALAHCPIQGYGYLNLLETSFISHLGDQYGKELLNQAILVRGHDPRVLYIAGREALMANDRDAAFGYWNTVFHSSEYFRLNILKLLAPQVEAGFFIHQFQPNAEELMDLLRVYIALERSQESDLIRRQLCKVIPEESPTLDDDDERLKMMLFASQFAMELEDHPLAVQILEQTLASFPTAYDAHHRLAVTYYALESYQQALVHLKWCHEWDPGSEWVPELIRSSRMKLVEIAEANAAAQTTIQQASWQQDGVSAGIPTNRETFSR
ncbi:MAG: O-antigen ligase family protein [Fuerstiella sp.]